MLCANHGPCISGAHNAIVTARAGKDLVSSLVSGTLFLFYSYLIFSCYFQLNIHFQWLVLADNERKILRRILAKSGLDTYICYNFWSIAMKQASLPLVHDLEGLLMMLQDTSRMHMTS